MRKNPWMLLFGFVLFTFGFTLQVAAFVFYKTMTDDSFFHSLVYMSLGTIMMRLSEVRDER